MADRVDMHNRAGILGNKAISASTTARRYAELNGGSDHPEGEVWDHIAELFAMVYELAALIQEGVLNG